ncbi:MAG TPA: archease, partial [Burkholderiales bacterium]|nr:archease [Burkholderiales bacterium]
PRTTRWEHYEHAAGLGVRGFGASKAEAFEQAGLALSAAVADLRTIGQFEAVAIDCAAPDDERLLAEWLNALAAQLATRRLLFGRFAVKIDGTRLHAQAWGEPIDPERHRPGREVKGATQATLRVARHGEGWVAQTVLRR